VSDVRRGRVKGAWLFAAVALLAGCGGGGGDAPAPAPSAVDSSGPLALNAANAADVATLSPSAGELVLQFAQVAVDGASRRLSSPTSQTQACANGGLVTTTLGIVLVFFPAQQISSLLSYEVWMFGGTLFFIGLAAFFFYVYGGRKAKRVVAGDSPA